MNIDVTEIIALFAQLAGPAFSVAFVFGFGAKLVHSFLSEVLMHFINILED